jgi:hypothetical protein
MHRHIIPDFAKVLELILSVLDRLLCPSATLHSLRLDSSPSSFSRAVDTKYTLLYFGVLPPQNVDCGFFE